MVDNHSARARVKAALANRTVAVIRAERDRAKVAIQTARDRFSALTDEMYEAMAREAVPHPLLGKKVRRVAKGFYGATRVQRGTVEQNPHNRPLYVGSRQYRTTALPGECYVRTASGKGAYSMAGPEWELDQ